MLAPIGEGAWVADGGIVSFFGFPYPTRSVIARLGDGALWVWSPIRLAPGLRAEVDALGPVGHLVSPNRLHHLFLAEWKAAYPEARLWGPHSTILRHPELGFGPPLRDDAPPEWGPAIEQAWFRGSLYLDEIVFLHRPSRTVMVADLIQAFNECFLHAHWHWWQRPLARRGGIMVSDPGAPRDLRLSFLRRSAARAARAKVLGWDCEQVVIAHGDWQRSGGHDLLARSLDWLGR